MIEDFLYKLAELEKATENSIVFARYSFGWEVHSFRDNTPFGFNKLKNGKEKNYAIVGKTFEEVFNKAYERIKK